MRYLLTLLFLLSATVLWSADIITNGKVGKVIKDKPVLDTSFIKVADKTISDTIIMGRAVIDRHRYDKKLSYLTEMSHEDRVATNYTRLMGMRAKLKVWGFKDEADMIKQSRSADIKARVKDTERWK